jgi:hypothetical protein
MVPKVHLHYTAKKVGLKIEQKRVWSCIGSKMELVSLLQQGAGGECENERDGGCGW